MSCQGKSSSAVPFQPTCCPCIEILDSSSYTPLPTSAVWAGQFSGFRPAPSSPQDSSEETSFEHLSWSTASSLLTLTWESVELIGQTPPLLLGGEVVNAPLHLNPPSFPLPPKSPAQVISALNPHLSVSVPLMFLITTRLFIFGAWLIFPTGL